MDGRRLGLGVVSMLASLALPARASTVTGLSFRGPAECPAEAAFVAAVEARGGRVDQATSNPTGRSFDVAIRKAASGFDGSLLIRGRDGASDPREVHAEDCGAVVNGLAVVTAIALRDQPEAALASAKDPPPTPEPAAPDLRAPMLAPVEDDRLHDTSLAANRTIRVDAGKVEVKYVGSASLSAGFVSGVIPSLTLPRYDLSLSGTSAVTPQDGRHYLVGPVIRVRVSLLGGTTYHAANADTDIIGTSFGIDLCRTPYYDTRGAVLLLCAEYAGGSMTFDTHDAVAGKTLSKTAGFGTVGFNVELQYNLASHLLVTLRGGGDAAVGPLSAERADGSEVFQTSKNLSFSGYVVAGIGAHY
jgi:hypothetical protein